MWRPGDLLAPLVQETHVASNRCLGPIWQDLLPLLALGPAALLHRLPGQVRCWEGSGGWGWAQRRSGALEDLGKGPNHEVGPRRYGSMGLVRGVRVGEWG